MKSKLKEREKELKQIKKNRSLKREMVVEDGPAKVERKEEDGRKDREVRSNEDGKEIVEEKMEEVGKEAEEEARV